jgi:bla regulator protein blaR1
MTTTLKKILPVGMIAFLVLAFIMLSNGKSPQVKADPQAQDTTKKKSATYSRKSITTFDEQGNPHEEVTESFEGDEELKEAMEFNFPFNFQFDMPNMPSLPDTHSFNEGLMVPPMPEGFFYLDTLHFKNFGLNQKGFENFDRDLEALLKERFESFGPDFEANMEGLAKQLEKMKFQLDDQLGDLENNVDEMERLNDALKHSLDPDRNVFDSESSGVRSVRMNQFETAAQEELVKDGYLKPEEKIESISWSEDEIKFNGITIQPEHEKKYRELKRKYLGTNRSTGRPE